MSDYRLYIWVRTDLASMTPGKACAQVAHAASAHAAQMQVLSEHNRRHKAWREWANSAVNERHPKSTNNSEHFKEFGTTIVLQAENRFDMDCLLERFNNSGDFAGMIVDPSYPIRDGEATVFSEVATVCWAFIDPSMHRVVSEYQLY